MQRFAMFRICLLITSMCHAADGISMTIQGAPRHPTVYLSPSDVEYAREAVDNNPVARKWFQSVVASVKPWGEKSPDWIRSVMPEEGACFAYGFTGCPICNTRWSAWIKAPASFDKPGKVVCSNGHVLPNEDYPDSGTGYVALDGRIHYFVGSYNAWVVETLLYKVAVPYADIYLIEGDEHAGRMAATVLDELAYIYPSCNKGSWDYPSDPPSGRLNRPWYQVARTLVDYVDIYDRIFDHPCLEEPSSREGLTKRENIERNLLLNGALYCHEQTIAAPSLHNGQADYIRGLLAVGVVLGIPELIDYALNSAHGIRTMIANNIGRDGQYYETSASYGDHTRELYLGFAEPLYNYRSPKYPQGLNLYDDPQFASFFLLPQMAWFCEGHKVPMGDASPAIRPPRATLHPVPFLDAWWTEMLAARASQSDRRTVYAALLGDLLQRDPDGSGLPSNMMAWRTFHEPPLPNVTADLPRSLQDRLTGSFFFGQKGAAVLRVGRGADAQAALLRYGPSLNHGHFDDLNVNYFKQGYELGYDLGYGVGSTHTQVGWAKQTASHNCVVVDETPQGGGTWGGSLLHFADWPGLTLTEANSTAYRHLGVDVYRRLFALTDEYALDVFRVHGGRRHDLPLHSLTTEISHQGLTFGPQQTGSLAGKEHEWGNLQLNDGDMEGHPNKPYWNPPPGNGYGFLVEPAFANAHNPWSVTWNIADEPETRFQLLPCPLADEQVISAEAPGVYPYLPRARYIIRRRTGEPASSCFASVWQAWNNDSKPAVKSVQLLSRSDRSRKVDASLILAVDLHSGLRDIWFLNPNADSSIEGQTDTLEFEFRGAIARCRMEGDRLLRIEMLNGTHLRVGQWCFSVASPQWSGTVEKPPGDDNAIVLDRSFPSDNRFVGDPVYFDDPQYSRNTAYTVASTKETTLHVESATTRLGTGLVSSIVDEDTLSSNVPHEYARSVTRKPTGFFVGKRIASFEGDASASIRQAVPGAHLILEVDSTAGFVVGDRFYYCDVQLGDRCSIQHQFRLDRLTTGEYMLSGNTDVEVKRNGPDGRSVTQTVKASNRGVLIHEAVDESDGAIQPATTQAASAEAVRSELTRDFDRQAEAKVNDWLQLEPDNSLGTICWAAGYTLAALVEMLDATHDPKYATLFVRLADWIDSGRDDRRGIEDELRETIMPGWSATKYDKGKRHVYVVHSGMIVYPFARFASIVRKHKGLSDQFGERADRYLEIARETMQAHDDQFREGPAPDEGYVVGGKTNELLPLNMSTSPARAWIYIDDASGTCEYGDQTARIAHFFKNRLKQTPGGAYQWAYWPKHDNPGEGAEDISHAAINADFMMLCADRGIVFGEQVFKGLSRTVLERIIRSDGTVADHIDGSDDPMHDYARYLLRWGRLARHCPQVRDALLTFYQAGTFDNGETDLLGIAYLVTAYTGADRP